MRLGRALVLTVLLAAGAALVWLGGATAWAAHRESRALAAWGPDGLEAAIARIPKKETNPAAHDLEKVALALGIDLKPRGASSADDTQGSGKESKTEWERIRGPFTKWVTGEAERPEANVGTPPAEVAAFLTGHAAEIDGIEKALLSGPAPEWAQDPSQVFAAPAPSLAGHLQLHVLVLGRALARAAAGDAAGAEKTLLASWNLAAPERARVDIPARTIAFLATHLQLGVLRKLPADASAWRTRIAGLEPRRWVREGWEFEAWRVWRSGRRLQEGATGGWLAGLAARPRERLAGAALLDGWHAMSEEAAKSPVSDGDAKPLAEAFENAAGRWAAPSMPSILAAAGGIRRADRLTLEGELTDKVFDIRARHEPSVAWPASIPGIEVSKAANVKWTYTVTAEGRASLATNRLLNWPDRASSILGWVSEPPAAKKPTPKKK